MKSKVVVLWVPKILSLQGFQLYQLFATFLYIKKESLFHSHFLEFINTTSGSELVTDVETIFESLNLSDYDLMRYPSPIICK